jgi:hypothetical protein
MEAGVPPGLAAGTGLGFGMRHNETAAEGQASQGGLEDFYRVVNERLVELWRDEGGHAFIHHLNALFGYEETFIYERRLMRF